MKTLSPDSDQDEDAAAVKSSVNGDCCVNGDRCQSETPNERLSERENLIICDSQLASSFQEVKVSKARLNPGHYLQKVFLHKLRSRSVPSLEKQKKAEGGSPHDKDNDETTPLEVCECEDEVDEDLKESNNWYKTWPECGLEKCPRPPPSPKKLTPQGSLEEEKKDCDIQSNFKPNTPVPLGNVLRSLPLAYSPITKQIHLIKSGTDVPINGNQAETPWESRRQGEGCEKVSNRVVLEASSYSSTVSSLSDHSPTSTNGDSAVGSLLENGDNCSLISIGNCSVLSEDAYPSRPRKKGISGLFSRGVFNWRGRDEVHSDSWNLFRKSYDSDERVSSSLSLDIYPAERKCVGRSSNVAGSTGLIQLERPAWLPAKSKQEQQLHADQHDKILQSAKKKEVKEAKQRKKMLQSQYKAEDELASTIKVWTTEILPKWHQVRSQKKTLDLWWMGVPPCIRGKLWKLAINNDLNITHDLYEICVSRAEERLKSARGSTDSVCEVVGEADRESSMELIQLDISRTFPSLCIFQKGGPYYDMLHSLLAAYVCYRPDVGYVQGMSFIAAVLILNMDAPDAFICFANLLNRPCHRAFYSLDQPLMEAYYSSYKILLKENLPKLFDHLEKVNLSPDLYLLDWVYTVFAKAMHLDLASRIWDVFLRDGEEFLFRAAIGVLKISQDCLLGMDFVSGSKYLTRLPDDLTPCQLFKAIGSVRMSSGKLTFSQILESFVMNNTG